jgi:hypothetical protein
MYKSATEIQNNICLNVNIVLLIQANNPSSNDYLHLASNVPESEDDECIRHDEVIGCTAKIVLLGISAILELAHTSDKGVIPFPWRLTYYVQLRLGFILVKNNMLVKTTYSVNAAEKIYTKIRAILYQWLRR